MSLPDWSRDLVSLELLLGVAEFGSVGKSAAALGISQPAASTRLNRLERQTGLALLARSPAGTTLTPVGQAFASWARQVIVAAQIMTDGVAALRETRAASLRIAASLTVAEYLMPAWLMLLRRQNPELDVKVAVANSHDVCDRVRAGQADIGLVEMPMVPADLSSAQIGVDRLIVVVAPTYPAAGKRDRSLAPTELLDQPVLLREEGSGTRDTFVAALAAVLGRHEPLSLPHVVELGSTTTILATARAGGGIGVISERAARSDLATGSLVELTVPGLDAFRPLTAVWLGRQLGKAGQSLVKLAQQSDN